MIVTSPPHERPTLRELAAGNRRDIDCPKCGNQGFTVTNTWHLIDGTKRRLRQCRFCEFVRSESVFVKPDGE